MNIQELKVSLFANHHAYTSSLVSLTQIVNMIRFDRIIAANTESYRKTMVVMGKKHANTHIKQKLVPAFSVAVTFHGLGHSESQAEQFTGLAHCDIDHFDSEAKLEAAFERLSKDPHVLLMYRTISGLGLRVLYWYKRENNKRIDDTSWRGAYYVGNEHLAAIAQHEYDDQTSDYTRLSGMAGDQNVYVNPKAEPFIVTDDMIVVQNCEHQEHGRPRKVYGAKSFETTADEAWQRVQQMLNEKNVRYEPGHHHDYIMHAAYLFKRFGVPLDDVIKFADIEWPDHPKDERNRAIRHQYKDDTLLGTWRLNASEKSRDNSLLTLPEIRKWLSERVSCCYNTVTCQVFWCSKADVPEANTDGEETLLPLTADVWKPLDTIEINTRYNQITFDTGRRIKDGDMERVYYSDFARPVHPIRQYMQLLPDWDGRDRVLELALHIHVVAAAVGMTDSETHEAMLWAMHKWLLAMIASWLYDNIENQAIFTLIGPQGIYKTTFFRFLLPPPLQSYFKENKKNSVGQKDDLIAMVENCLISLDEVDAFEGAELSRLKGVVTSEKIKLRRPYAKAPEEHTRMASLCATTNIEHILTDLSGNRRWLCFKVSSIDDPHQWDLDYEQLYAQLLKEFRDGFPYYFTPEDEARINKLNEPFMLISPEEQLISIRLRKPRGREPYKLMSSEMINQLLNYGRHTHLFSNRKIGDVMSRLGYTREHKKSGYYYRVVEIPFDQQQIFIAEDNGGHSFELEDPQEPDSQ
ncbi:VapE domain-containing protein [Xylanibacter ruminicola]|uniref:Virulence-associated protein E n=1 Tax=Xylanibacter ruminicola TaxID=839 RepID=A0A1M6YR01_XYLRU|nr:VapE domain-containing protein [Xylanibacter ruminicola]SHL20570.1 Virulence-associated protein E [Xylanibacter ruminicola]